MKYQKKPLDLKDPLSFWQHFNREERIYFYNPLNQELIIGAKRLKAFSPGDEFKDYIYTFSSRSFFESVKDPKWAEFGNETLAFAYYLVEKEGRQTLYYLDEEPEIRDLGVRPFKHIYRYSPEDYPEWQELFSQVHRRITAGEVDKVVISREIKLECDTPVHIGSVIKNLQAKNQNSFIFAYFKDGKTFLGATPEILVQKAGADIISYALAGTISRHDHNDEGQKNALLHDSKNRVEHQIVIDAIAGVMKKHMGEVNIGETRILTLRNLHHLQTRIAGQDNHGTLKDWVTRLHPTPALGGNPVHKALEIIRTYERHERGLYAAPLGMIDEQGDGIFVAGIRSALIQDNLVFAYTGCGIVEKSECENEYVETGNKVKTIMESL